MLLKNLRKQPNRQVITAAVQKAYADLKGLDKGQLGARLAELAKLPVGAEVSRQLREDLPELLHSLRLSLSKRQYLTTDKSLAELAVLQARSIKEAWGEIKSSEQLTVRSREKITSIEGRLKVMEDEYCVKIRKLLAASESQKFDEAQRKNIVSKMKTLYIGLRSEYITVSADISECPL